MHTRGVPIHLPGLGLAIALALAGCGGDDGPEPISAAKFADGMCSALGDFAAEAKKAREEKEVVDALAGQTEEGEGASKLVPVYEKLFKNLERNFPALIAKIEELGPPDIKDGADFRDEVLDGLEISADKIGETASELGKLKVGDDFQLTDLAPVIVPADNALAEVNKYVSEGPKAMTSAIDKSKTCTEVKAKYNTS